MASSAILDNKSNGIAILVKPKSYPQSTLTESDREPAKVLGISNNLERIYSSDYSIASFTTSERFVSAFQDVLPFRVAFTTLGIESYGPNNPAPIGIAIIGFNNYIL